MKISCKCGCTKFFVNALVTETWRVDSEGNWEDTLEQDVYQRPGSQSDYTCRDCGEIAEVEF